MRRINTRIVFIKRQEGFNLLIHYQIFDKYEDEWSFLILRNNLVVSVNDPPRCFTCWMNSNFLCPLVTSTVLCLSLLLALSSLI
jgi:hypothetical protein